jgi:hypothetical protein
MKVRIELANGHQSANTWQITFIFILILFVDSVNRVYRVQLELAMAKQQGGAAG